MVTANSIFISVLNAIIVQLSVPSVAEKVYRNRGRAIPVGVTTAVDVRFVQASAKRETISGPIDWQVVVVVDCYARGEVGSGDVAVDSLMQAVFTKLAQDETLGGTVAGMSVPDIQGDVSEAADSNGWMSLTYEVSVRSSGVS